MAVLDGYTYKCPGCGAALEYDVNTNLMICNNCGQLYAPEQVVGEAMPTDGVMEMPYQAGESAGAMQQEVMYEIPSGDEYMQVNIYHCASCGSELMTNDVEAAKFCAYCGQPSIMFDRVSNEIKPQKIIPFKIKREEAIDLAKSAFSKAKYLSKKCEDITVDSVKGIYIPYYAIHSKMELMAEVKIKSSDSPVRTYEKRGELEKNVFLDASKKFNDDVSRNLNPFPENEAVPFEPVYLSGFYADRADVKSADIEKNAHDYIEEILRERLIMEVPGAPARELRRKMEKIYAMSGAFAYNKVQDSYEVLRKEYVFCPVYFITFKTEYELVILLVNGSTGKIVGSLPLDHQKFEKAQKKNSIIGTAIGAITGAVLFRFMPIVWSAMLFFILGGWFLIMGRAEKRHYETMYKKTNSKAMFDLSGNR